VPADAHGHPASDRARRVYADIDERKQSGGGNVDAYLNLYIYANDDENPDGIGHAAGDVDASPRHNHLRDTYRDIGRH
jgi:hypothetical protein